MPRLVRFFLLVHALCLLSGCNSCPVNGQAMHQIAVGATDKLVVDTYVSGLEIPWAMAWAPDGRLFVTERPGRLRVIEHGQLEPEPIKIFDDVHAENESGLMGLALHPDFETNHLIYVCYATKNADLEVRVKRMRIERDGVHDETIILPGIPGGEFHAGCRLQFGPDKKLYVTTGDKTERALAQKLDSLAGKTLRINDDGTVPRDNPFVNVTNARPEIWSLGHRNAQGMAFQPGTGLMFQTEHGPSGFDGPGGGDEVNLVERGLNYGWPIVHHKKNKENMVAPLLEYTPALAPAGATFFSGKHYPKWQGSLFFACLRGQSIVRVEIKDRKVLQQERLFENQFGRIRDISEGPDGALYFSTSNRDGRGKPNADDDRILRIRFRS